MADNRLSEYVEWDESRFALLLESMDRALVNVAGWGDADLEPYVEEETEVSLDDFSLSVKSAEDITEEYRCESCGLQWRE